jgi:hypothetical protein
MPEHIDRASVFRQRRLLFAVTFAICAFHYLHASPAESFSIGAFSFKHSASRGQIGVALWIMWFWAVIRYRQYEKTFRNDALSQHRERLTTLVCIEAANRAIQAAVRSGTYESRGVGRDQIVEVILSPDVTVLPLEGPTGWALPNLMVRVRKPDGGWTWLQGGANCSFSESEVIAMQKQIEQRLIIDYPHFTDFKVPYGVAVLAILAGLYEAVQSLKDAIPI